VSTKEKAGAREQRAKEKRVEVKRREADVEEPKVSEVPVAGIEGGRGGGAQEAFIRT
jgi:hypothetical protein